MNIKQSPKEYGLPARTVIQKVDDKTIAIVINRKSRIIMADGKKIYEKIELLKTFHPEAVFALKTSAPICSKTIEFLKDQNIKLI